MTAILLVVWNGLRAVFSHRAAWIAAGLAGIFAAGWLFHRQPVAVTKTETKSSTAEASFTMGRIGLRIKGGTTVLTLNAEGVIVSISNTGGELLMVQRTSATRTAESQTHQTDVARIPPPPLLGGSGAHAYPRWGLGVGAGIGTDLVPRYGAIGTAHLFGPFDVAAVATVPPALYGFALARW